MRNSTFRAPCSALRTVHDEVHTRGLIWRAQRGDLSARNALLKENKPMVVTLAARIYRPGSFFELEDLIQQGCLGLLRAIQKFDLRRRRRGPPSARLAKGGRHVRFSTYAIHWIRHFIYRELANTGRTVAVPVHIQGLMKMLERSLDERHPTLYQAGRDRGLSKSCLEHISDAVRELVPLDYQVDGEEPLADCLPLPASEQDDPEHAFDRRHRREWLAAFLCQLPQRESYVVTQSFGLQESGTPRTLHAIGRDLGVSETRAQQLRFRALRRLKASYTQLQAGASQFTSLNSQ